MNKINDSQKNDPKKRATRNDVAELEKRLAGILNICDRVTDENMPRSLTTIALIASGKTLDELIMEAGREALGLGS